MKRFRDWIMWFRPSVTTLTWCALAGSITAVLTFGSEVSNPVGRWLAYMPPNAASILGGLLTLCAAFLAWQAVENQIRSAIDLATRSEVHAKYQFDIRIVPALNVIEFIWLKTEQAEKASDAHELEDAMLDVFHIDYDVERMTELWLPKLYEMTAAMSIPNRVASQFILQNISMFSDRFTAYHKSFENRRSSGKPPRDGVATGLKLWCNVVADAVHRYDPTLDKYFLGRERVAIVLQVESNPYSHMRSKGWQNNSATTSNDPAVKA